MPGCKPTGIILPVLNICFCFFFFPVVFSKDGSGEQSDFPIKDYCDSVYKQIFIPMGENTCTFFRHHCKDK